MAGAGLVMLAFTALLRYDAEEHLEAMERVAEAGRGDRTGRSLGPGEPL
jgi:hypothetical protein